MKCPPDGTTERTGVKIDHCAVARGMWLDRGELDGLIDRGAGLGDTGPVRPDDVTTTDHADHADHAQRTRMEALGPNASACRSLPSRLSDHAPPTEGVPP